MSAMQRILQYKKVLSAKTFAFFVPNYNQSQRWTGAVPSMHRIKIIYGINEDLSYIFTM